MNPTFTPQLQLDTMHWCHKITKAEHTERKHHSRIGGGAPGMRPLPSPQTKISSISRVCGKVCKIAYVAPPRGSATSLREILDPPLVIVFHLKASLESIKIPTTLSATLLLRIGSVDAVGLMQENSFCEFIPKGNKWRMSCRKLASFKEILTFSLVDVVVLRWFIIT